MLHVRIRCIITTLKEVYKQACTAVSLLAMAIVFLEISGTFCQFGLYATHQKVKVEIYA